MIFIMYPVSGSFHGLSACSFNVKGGSTVNKVSTARAMLILAFFGAGALSVHATDSSCVDCHTNQAIMQKLVSPPAASEAEGEG